MKPYRRMKCRKKACFAIFLFGVFGALISDAAEMYRWVDENGRTHFSDTPPHQSKRTVTRIDSQKYEISAEQLKEAAARAANEKKRATAIAERKDREASVPSSSAPQTGNAAAKPLPAATDCASLLKRFREHNECLAPFMNVGGSFKPNAFETCGPAVPYPAQECS